MKRIATAIVMILALALGASAKYTIHSVAGDVKVRNRTTVEKATKGREVTGLEKLILGKNSSVELLNSGDSKIYRCDKPGEYTASEIMFKAASRSSNNLSNVNRGLRFGAMDKQDGKVYKDQCAVTRSLEVYDPEASDIQIDADLLAQVIAGVVKGGEGTPLPAELSSQRSEEGDGLEFRLANTLDFPLYLNVVRYSKSCPSEVRISQLGTPVGCYILLPGQTMMRGQGAGLDPDEVHILFATHCYFDIDSVIENTATYLTGPGADDELEQCLDVSVVEL